MTESERFKLPSSAFALPERRCYPIVDDASAKGVQEQADADLQARRITRAQHARIMGAVSRFNRRRAKKAA